MRGSECGLLSSPKEGLGTLTLIQCSFPCCTQGVFGTIQAHTVEDQRPSTSLLSHTSLLQLPLGSLGLRIMRATHIYNAAMEASGKGQLQALPRVSRWRTGKASAPCWHCCVPHPKPPFFCPCLAAVTPVSQASKPAKDRTTKAATGLLLFPAGNTSSPAHQELPFHGLVLTI